MGLLETSPAEQAFRRIERLQAPRDHAVEELRQRLLREKYAADAVEEALARAVRCGLLDDMRFAETLVRSRLAADRGARGIEAELEGWGIDPGSVEWPEADEYDEVERALALLERKPPRSKNQREGAYRRLMQKGYGSSVAATAARRWAEREQAGSY